MIPIKAVTTLLLILITSFMLYGCTGTKATTVESTTDTPSVDIEIPNVDLGNIIFKQDEPHTVSKEFLADGNDFSISVIDTLGYEWELTIPANALLTKETISMTPMTEIKNGTFPTTPSSGIILQPDGLQFLQPAVIRVKNTNEKGIILSGNHQGGEISFVPVQDENNMFTSLITHFSIVVFQPNDDPRITNLQEIAKQQYMEAVNAVKKLLKTPIETKQPPSISLECFCDKQYNSAREFANEISKPENTLIGQLLSAGRSVALLGGDTSNYEFSLSEALIDRNMKKISELILKNNNQDEKFLPVFYAALSVYRDAALFKSVDLDELSVLGSWAAKVRDHSIDKIRNEHKYKLAGTIIELEKIASIWNMGDLNSTLEKLNKALTFKIIFDGYVYSDSEDGSTTWYTKGEIMIHQTGYNFSSYQGEGTGIHSDYQVTSDILVKILLTKDFPVVAGLYEVNFCEEYGYFGIDRFGAASLTYQADWGDIVTVLSFYNYLELFLPEYYSKHYSMYMVPVVLQNGQSEFQETMDGTLDDGKISYIFKLVHSPQ